MVKSGSERLIDYLLNLPYKQLSKKEEILFIKKLKLSYYYDVSEEEREKYLNYYFEAFPLFKKKYEQASREEKENLLEKAIDNSKIWRDKFLKNNQRLVYSLAKTKSSDYSIEELFQEGNIGMMIALKKFSIEQNAKFSTYASYWIRQSISRYISGKSRLINVPSNLYHENNRLIGAEKDFIAKYYRKPSIEELSAITGFSEEVISILQKYNAYQSHTFSLDRLIDFDNDDYIIDLILDDSELVQDVVENNIISENLRGIIKKANLDKRSKDILFLRYGFIDGTKYTYESIGKKYNLTRSRIRKIELTALKKLRLNDSIRKLFIDCDDLKKFEHKKNNNLNQEIEVCDSNDKYSFDEIRDMLINGRYDYLSAVSIKVLTMRYVNCFSSEDICSLLGLSSEELSVIEDDALNAFLIENGYEVADKSSKKHFIKQKKL